VAQAIADILEMEICALAEKAGLFNQIALRELLWK
jgi:hypothetical protein